MANITRDTFDPTKNYSRVVYQKGGIPADNELNEGGQIAEALAIEAARGANQAYTSVRTFSLGGNDASFYGYAEGTDWRPVVSGGVMSVTKGALYVDGVRLVLGADLDLSTEGITFGVVGGAAVFGLVYFDLALTEIDSGTDPDIATPQLGEQTRRMAYVVTWGKVESAVSWEDAWNGLAALTGSTTDDRVWAGFNARIILCRYYRPAADVALSQAEIVDCRRVTSALNILQRQLFVKCIRERSSDSTVSTDAHYEGDTASDGMIAWNLAEERLILGVDPGNGLPEDELRSGLRLDTPIGGTVFANHRMADQTKHTVGDGVNIPQGYALGYCSAYGPSYFNKEKLTVSPSSWEYAHSSNPALTAPTNYDVLQVQTLLVATITSFQNDAKSQILCVRRGNDLIWFNGDVTRGRAGTRQLTFHSLGEAPSEWTAIVGRYGVAHATKRSSLERVLSCSMADGGDSPGAIEGGVGAEAYPRELRFYMKPGLYHIDCTTNGERYYGSDYDSGGRIELCGDSCDSTTLNILAPAAGGRTSVNTAPGQVRLAAHEVIVRDLTVQQTAGAVADVTYALDIIADQVVIERCHFLTPIRVKAANIIIRDCTFESDEAATASLMTGITNEPGSQSLCLIQRGHTGDMPPVVKIERCRFIASNYYRVASMVWVNALDTTRIWRVYFDQCEFDYRNGFNLPNTPTYSTDGVGQIPAIVLNEYGRVDISRCVFWGAIGVYKAGYTDPGSGTFPFNANAQHGTLSHAYHTANYYQYQNPAYISMGNGRRRLSRTTIRDCVFDMSKVGYDTTGPRFALWGACMSVVSTSSVNAGLARVYNVTFEQNLVLAGAESYTAGGAVTIPCVWGFYVANSWANRCTEFAVTNIRAQNNTFRLGEANDGSLNTKAWRGIMPGNPAAWGGTARLADTVCLVGVSMKNGTVAPTTYGQGLAINIHVSSNTFSVDDQLDFYPDSMQAVAPVVQVDEAGGTLTNPYACRFILIEGGAWGVVYTPTITGAPYELDTGEGCTSVHVQNNICNAGAYLQAHLPGNTGMCAVEGTSFAIITGNTFWGSASGGPPTTGGVHGLRMLGSLHCLVGSNRASGSHSFTNGCASATNKIGNNYISDVTVLDASGGAPTVAHAGGGWGNNF